MHKLLLIAAVGAAALLSVVDTVSAQGQRDNRLGPDRKIRVTCPVGSCGPLGGRRPVSLDQCKPSNCRK
jgi:hypothetical protein